MGLCKNNKRGEEGKGKCKRKSVGKKIKKVGLCQQQGSVQSAIPSAQQINSS